MGSEDYKILKRSRSAHQAQLTKTYREFELQMSSQKNAESVTAFNEKLNGLFGKFRDMHVVVLKCCQPDEKESYEDSCDASLKNFEEFKDRYSQWRSAILSLEDCAQSSIGDSVKSASTTSSSSMSRLALARLRKLKAQRQLRDIDELF
ncbi:hypothetical protein DPMN_069780 [Dreissena polymorpha]|uniref:Uncharacterized protein n=1 Tax=Dreissena polymorpha TaxID=45954 RepID=A0A9D3Z470_DREPO|nr:hypothetical protein DPMN_069780 [Dreissena polymorpha]